MTNSEKLKTFLEQHRSEASIDEIATALGIKRNHAVTVISTYGKRLGVHRVRRGHYQLVNGNGHGTAHETAISAEIAALEQQKEALSKRIQWTTEETVGVANVLFQVWKRDPVKSLSGEDCIRAMHVAVHPQRWRKYIAGISQLPTVAKLLRERVLALIDRPEPEPVRDAGTQPQPVPPPQPEPLDLQAVPYPDLASAYLQRRSQVEEQTRADLRALMDLILESREPKAPHEPTASRPLAPAPPEAFDNRVRVFTFGLLGSQAHEIREEIQRCGYPVRYLKNVDNGDKAHVPESAEAVIFNNKHCNHGAFENVRNQTRQLGILLILASGAGKAKEAIRLLAEGKREPGAFAHLCV